MTRCQPQYEAFEKLAKRGNTIPVYCQLLGDHLTPVTAFSALSESSSHAFLLESVVRGENVARYSFLAADPQLIFEASGEDITVTRKGAEP
jgi:anthranilate synthase component 1